MNNAGFDFDVPFSRAARSVVAGYGFGLMFIFHQEPARDGMESGPEAHKLKALHCSQLIFVNFV